MKRRIKRPKKLWPILGLTVFVGLVIGCNLERLGFSSNQSDFPFATLVDAGEKETQTTYKQAEDRLEAHQYQEAIDHFQKIQSVRTAIRPLILLHEAEAFSQLGQEGKAQNLLLTIEHENRNSPFELLALYNEGQSALRGQDSNQAKTAFESVVQKDPDSNLAIGSQYYLGQIEKDQKQYAQAATYWRQYLKASSDGTFSDMAAEGLMSLPVLKSPEDIALLGEYWFQQERYQKALPLLEHAPFMKVWPDLGRAELRMGHGKEGIATLNKGLHLQSTQDQAEQAIKSLMSLYSSDSAKKNMLLKLLHSNPKVGADYMLWELHKHSQGKERLAYDAQLLKNYPDSNWAPETSWNLIWTAYKNHDDIHFMSWVDNHLKRYPTSNSAPKVLFWKAKLFLHRNNLEIAHSLLRELALKYPHNYYAYRAKQLLQDSKNPWQTTSNTRYPPPSRKEVIHPESLAQFTENPEIRPAIADLIKMECPKDITLLLQTESIHRQPGPLDSLILWQQRQYAQSLRTMRDYLESLRKAGKYTDNPDLMKIFYPVLYAEDIQEYASQNHLDPFLVQALIRQESYFNPLAISSSRALGLMQLLPSTAAGVAKTENIAPFNTASLFNPAMNIRLGTRYLRYLHERFNGNSMMAVGSYNGGPNAMARWAIASGIASQDPDAFIESIPAAQTRDYIKEVFSHYWNYKQFYLQ